MVDDDVDNPDHVALVEILGATVSHGWKHAFQRIQHGDYGDCTLIRVLEASMRDPSEDKFLRVLQAGCLSHHIKWPFETPEEAAPELRSFTYVRLPANDSEPPEELVALEQSFGDQLFTLLCPHFAAEADSSPNASQLSRAVAHGSVEVFALVRPSNTTQPVPFTGTYMYYDEIGSIKSLKENHRAGALAVECGWETSPFYGDVFIGSVVSSPSPARQASFALDDLSTSAVWIQMAPGENQRYAEALEALEALETPAPPVEAVGAMAVPNSGDATGGVASEVERARSLMHTVFTGMRAPLPRTVRLEGCGTALHLEQSTERTLAAGCGGDPTGALVWDCGVAMATYLACVQRRHAGMGAAADRPAWTQTALPSVAGKRVLELGAGTGIVGLAAAALGAASVCATDLASQLPLLRRNVAANGVAPSCNVEVEELCWSENWQHAYPRLAERAAAGAFDWVVASDCVYGTASARPFAALVLALLRASPVTLLLLAYESRPLPPSEWNHGDEFFALMEAEGCVLSRLPDLGPSNEGEPWAREEISLWLGRMHPTGGMEVQ